MDRAEQIFIGPWTISARRAPDGTLSLEVLLGDEPHAKLELDAGVTAAESRRSKRELQSKLDADMDY
jgi:hypothetical protein